MLSASLAFSDATTGSSLEFLVVSTFSPATAAGATSTAGAA